MEDKLEKAKKILKWLRENEYLSDNAVDIVDKWLEDVDEGKSRDCDGLCYGCSGCGETFEELDNDNRN